MLICCASCGGLLYRICFALKRRSVSKPGTPIIDAEWHPFSTVTWRDPNIPAEYPKSVMWLAASHGLSATTSWFWGRNNWSPEAKLSAEFGGADFYGSMQTQPFVMGGFASTAVQINALGKHFAAVATTEPQVAILYSEASALAAQGGGADKACPYLDIQLATYSLAHFFGVRTFIFSLLSPSLSLSRSLSLSLSLSVFVWLKTNWSHLLSFPLLSLLLLT